MEQSGQSPLLLIIAQSPGEGAHDGFRRQHVFDKVLVFDVLFYRLQGFLTVHLP